MKSSGIFNALFLVFVASTGLLAAACFHLYQLVHEHQLVSSTLIAERDRLVHEREVALELDGRWRRVLGLPLNLPPEAALANVVAEWQNNPVPETELIDLMTQIRSWRQQVDSNRQRVDTLNAINESLIAELKAAQPRYQDKVDFFEKKQREIAAELQAERQRSANRVLALDNQVALLSDRVASLQTELANAQQARVADARKAEAAIEKLSATIKALKSRTASPEPSAKMVPIGEIVLVQRRQNTAVVSVRTGEQLQVGATLTLRAKNDMGTGQERGTAEVLRIDGSRATVRLILKSPDVLLLPGDQVCGLVSQNTGPRYFGLVGKLDPDGDGRDDHARLAEIVRRQRGEILVDLTESGQLTGVVSPRLEWLVADFAPGEVKDAAFREKMEQIVRQTREFGGQVISSRRLLELLGESTAPTARLVEQ